MAICKALVYNLIVSHLFILHQPGLLTPLCLYPEIYQLEQTVFDCPCVIGLYIQVLHSQLRLQSSKLVYCQYFHFYIFIHFYCITILKLLGETNNNCYYYYCQFLQSYYILLILDGICSCLMPRDLRRRGKMELAPLADLRETDAEDVG